MKTKTCCMFNYGPHYRDSIYSKIDKELNYHLYFGHKVPGNIKKIDVSTYQNYQKDLRNIFIKNVYWQRGAIRNVFKPYTNYIMDGDLSLMTTWIVMILARLSRKNVFLWSHGYYERDSRFKSAIKKMFFGLSHKVLLYGDHAKQLMMNHGFPEEKLIGIYNSLDYDEQKNVRDKLTFTDVFSKKFGNDYPVLVYIGRIQKWKRLDLLIDAILKMNKDAFYVNLIIIGAESEDTGVYDYIEKNNVSDQIWLYGETYNEEEIGSLIYNSNICVSPGNVGLTAIHSLMYGTPVITHGDFGYQGPEVESIIDGVNGLFYKRNDSHDLARKIRWWLENHPSTNEVLREKCYKIVDERYNPYYQIEVLRKVVGEG